MILARLAPVPLVLLFACAPRADREALRQQRVDGLVARHLELQLLASSLTLAHEGEALFHGRGGCSTCHRIDDRGTRYTGPNLGLDPDCKNNHAAVTRSDPFACSPLAERARARRPALPALQYFVESMVDPDHVTVPGYARGVMKRVDEPPLSLSDDDVLRLAVYLTQVSRDAADSLTIEILDDTRQFFAPCREHRDRRLEASRDRQ